MSDLLVAAQIANDGNNDIVVAYSSETVNVTGQSSRVAPALAMFKSQLWIAYIGESSGEVKVISSANGKSWSEPSSTGISSKVSPALAVFEGQVWIAYIGESSGEVKVISSANGKSNWSAPILTGQSSKLSPALAVFEGQV